MRDVLLLNQGYIPIGVVSWKKAVQLVIGRCKAEYVVNYSKQYPACFHAAVIRLTVSTPDPFRLFSKQRFSKTNLFLRDKFRCQYCSVYIPLSSGTIDHVLPSSRGGKTCYYNCVASCRKCNSKKDNKTPLEAKMPLKKKPKAPTTYDLFFGRKIPDEWEQFLLSIKKGW